MAEVTNDLIVQILQRIQSDVSELKTDVREIRHRVGSLEVQMSGISSRMDRRDDMMERVMRRLELTDDTHTPNL